MSEQAKGQHQGRLLVGGSSVASRLCALAALLSLAPYGAQVARMPLEMRPDLALLGGVPKRAEKRQPGPGAGTNRMRRRRQGKNW